MSVKEAQQIISESLEVQKKANAARAASFSQPSQNSGGKKRPRGRFYGNERASERRRSGNRHRSGPTNTARNRNERGQRPRQTGRSYGSKSRKAGSGDRA